MITRRKLLALCAAGTTGILAGCSGDDEGDSTDGNGNGDGSDDGGAGNGDDGNDDGSDTGDGTDDGTDNGDGTDDGTDNGDGTDSGSFDEVVRFTESYAMDATIDSEQGPIEMSGRFSQGDLYWEYTVQGQQIEVYFVGDETFFVFDGQCIQGSTQSGVDRDQVDPSQYDPGESSAPSVDPTGTDTIDGEEVLVYDITDGTTEGTLTYYVLADSGYPRRIETPTGTWNFHSWGEVDPIEAPEMNCQQASG